MWISNGKGVLTPMFFFPIINLFHLGFIITGCHQTETSLKFTEQHFNKNILNISTYIVTPPRSTYLTFNGIYSVYIYSVRNSYTPKHIEWDNTKKHTKLYNNQKPMGVFCLNHPMHIILSDFESRGFGTRGPLEKPIFYQHLQVPKINGVSYSIKRW